MWRQQGWPDMADSLAKQTLNHGGMWVRSLRWLLQNILRLVLGNWESLGHARTPGAESLGFSPEESLLPLLCTLQMASFPPALPEWVLSIVDLSKEVNWGKLKIVKSKSLFRNSRGIAIREMAHCSKLQASLLRVWGWLYLLTGNGKRGEFS